MRIGIDIGGTKCAVVLGDERRVIEKRRFETTTPHETLERILEAVEELGPGEAIGISCGGPLDSQRGLIQSPPNLPGWDDVPIVEMLWKRFGVPTALCNDANACGLAEWRYGAGRGTKNMIFLTFGTGLGAGLILDGKLYEGTNGMAGEAGHIRLRPQGPTGYGKAGSFEGFCSGGGLAQLGKELARAALARGEALPYCAGEEDLNVITAKLLAEYADRGDAVALEAYRICGERLGEGLAVLVDLLNPEAIVIGSVFQRAEHLLRPHMEETLRREALEPSHKVCRVLPALLGDELGDYAALSVAYSVSV